MNSNNENTASVSTEDYTKAMNFIGQNLLTTLSQSIEKLPMSLRNRPVITQAMSAFMTNVIYKQFPKNKNSCQEMLEEFTKLVATQLDNISWPAQVDNE